MEKPSNLRRNIILIGLGLLVLMVLGIAAAFTAPKISEAFAVSEGYYSYNVRASIIQVTGVFNEHSSSSPFKYIVTVQIGEDPQLQILETSKNVPHVLPELATPGYHAVAIPDTDIAGYIDWEASRALVDNPVNSAGVLIYSYKLHSWATENPITLTCHEEPGSSGIAEVTCSEF